MSARILSGNMVRNERLPGLIKQFSEISPTPELAIIQVGDRPDSAAYIKAKILFGHKVGVRVHHIHLPQHISQEDVVDQIEKCNTNPLIKGIIVQLPLPTHIDKNIIISAIDPRKDIDGLTPTQVNLLSQQASHAIVPATARGIVELLSYYGIGVSGKRVTVVGRSQLVGKPIAELLKRAGAVVTVAHSQTQDLMKETRSSDVIIVAVGKSKLITKDHVRPGQVIVDVGINRGEVQLVGDVDFTPVSHAISDTGAITPVPGGVGPMTVLGLFENMLDASREV